MTAPTDATLNDSVLSSAVPEALIVRPVRPLVGTRRNVFVDVPGRAGSWVFPEQAGDAVIKLDIHLLAESFAERREAVRRLAVWADVGESSRLIIDDEPDRYYLVILSNDADPNEWLEAGRAVLEFRGNPYAYALELTTETLSLAGSPDSGDFLANISVLALPVVEITPTNGNLDGFSLDVNGYVLQWAGDPVASGDTITVSSVSDTVTRGANEDEALTGAFDPADVDMVDASGEFPVIIPGTNEWQLVWTGTATEVTIVITWRERFR